MERRHIDPAALLIAVLAVAIVPLTTVGLWDKLTMLFAIIIFIIVMSFTLVGERRQELQGFYEKFAVSLVLGLIFAVAAAYPIQESIVKNLWSDTDDVFGPDRDNILSNRATWIALGFGLLLAAALTAWLLWQARKDRDQVAIRTPESNDDKRVRELEEENELLRGERDQLKQQVSFWVREATKKPETTHYESGR